MSRENLIQECVEFIEDAFVDTLDYHMDSSAHFMSYPQINSRLAIVFLKDEEGYELSLRHAHSSFFAEDWEYCNDAFDHWDGQNNFHADKKYTWNDESGSWDEEECEVPEPEGGVYVERNPESIKNASEWVVDKYFRIMKERELNNVKD